MLRNEANAELLFNSLVNGGYGQPQGSLNGGGYGHNFSTPSILPNLMAMQNYSPLMSAQPFAMPYAQRGQNPYAEGGYGYQRQPNYIDTVMQSGGTQAPIGLPIPAGYQNYNIKNPYGNGFVERNTAQMGMGIGSADPDPRPMGWQNDYSAMKRNDPSAAYKKMLAAWQQSMQPPKQPKPVNRSLHRSPPSYGGTQPPAGMPPATTQPQMPAQPAGLNVQTAVGQGLPQYDLGSQLANLNSMQAALPWNQMPVLGQYVPDAARAELNQGHQQSFADALTPLNLQYGQDAREALRGLDFATQQARSNAGLQGLDYLLGRQNSLYQPAQTQAGILSALLGMIGGGLRGL